MSHFYASIKGSRGEATRCGDKRSGITGHIRGWDLGVSASMSVHGEVRTPSGKVKDPGLDLLSLHITSGSHDSRVLLDLGDWYRLADGTLASASPRAELILRAIRSAS